MITSYDRVQSFLQTQETLSIISTVFGWRKRRQSEAGVVKISITKTLENCAPYDLSLRTWEVLRNPDEFAMLYSGSFRATMQCLQRVDESNVVLYGQFNSSQHSVTFHCLFLVSWIKIDGGYATLLQSVDRVRLIREAPEPSESLSQGEEIAERWMELNQWYTLGLAFLLVIVLMVVSIGSFATSALRNRLTQTSSTAASWKERPKRIHSSG